VLDQAPGEIVCDFTEAVEAGYSEIEVFDSSAVPVTSGASSVDATPRTRMRVPLAPLADGVYTVKWRALSAVDGHTTHGSFAFIVGNPPGGIPPPPVEEPGRPLLKPGDAAAKAVGYLGLAVLVGTPLLLLLLRRAADQATRQVKRDANADPRPTRAFDDRAWWLMFCGSLALTATAVALLLSFGSDLSVVGGSLADVPGLYHGRVLLARALLGACALSVLVVSRVVGLRVTGPRTLFVLLALASASVATLPLAGHAAAASAQAIVLDGLHVFAVTAWLGGLIALASVILPGAFLLPSEARAAVVVPPLLTFSRIAPFLVALAVSTGGVLGLGMLGSLDAVLASPYGQVMLIKGSLATVPVGIGAYHRFRVMPPLRTSAKADRPPPLRRLARTLALEIAAGAVVLALAAMLSSVSPPAAPAAPGPDPEPQGLRFERLGDNNDSMRVVLVISPAPLRADGALYNLSVELHDADSGSPVVPVKEVRLALSLPEKGVSLAEIIANETAPGIHRAQTREIALPGEWTLVVKVRSTVFYDVRATFEGIIVLSA
jgi:copper transport protein